MVAAGVTVHYLFAALGQIPERRPSLEEVRFEIDQTFYLNLVFLLAAAVLLWIHWRGADESPHGQATTPARAR